MVYLGFVVDVCHRAAVCDETKKIIAPWCGIASVLHSSVSAGSVLSQTIPKHVGVFLCLVLFVATGARVQHP